MSAPIEVAVFGAGHWGPNLIGAFHNRGCSNVAWVVDPDAQRLAEVSGHFPDISTSQHIETVLEDERVDAVVVATPTSTHHRLAALALDAGKHVLVEKPIAATAGEAEDLCARAARAGRVLMVGHVFVYNTAALKVKDYIDQGELGRVFYISMVRTNLGPIRVDVDVTWDLASHDISLANHWLGAVPDSVTAAGHSWINEGIDDAAFATLRYPGDVLVNLHVSWLNPRKAREITVVGERRMLTFDDMSISEPLRLYDRHVTGDRSRPGFVDSFASFRMSVRDGDITIPRLALAEPLRTECDHFLDCIQNGTPPRSGGEQGRDVVRVLDAMATSLRERGREVAVAPPGDQR